MVGSAQIIPFPVHLKPHTDRLATALADLAAALAEQRQAIAAWRSALADLGVEVRATEASLLGHLGHLGVLHEGIAKLHGHARTLEAWGARHEATPDIAAPTHPQAERQTAP